MTAHGAGFGRSRRLHFLSTIFKIKNFLNVSHHKGQILVQAKAAAILKPQA